MSNYNFSKKKIYKIWNENQNLQNDISNLQDKENQTDKAKKNKILDTVKKIHVKDSGLIQPILILGGYLYLYWNSSIPPLPPSMCFSKFSTMVDPPIKTFFSVNEGFNAGMYQACTDGTFIYAIVGYSPVKIYKFTITGTYVNSITLSAAGGFPVLGGICVDNNYVYVTYTAQFSPIQRLYKIDKETLIVSITLTGVCYYDIKVNKDYLYCFTAGGNLIVHPTFNNIKIWTQYIQIDRRSKEDLSMIDSFSTDHYWDLYPPTPITIDFYEYKYKNKASRDKDNYSYYWDIHHQIDVSWTFEDPDWIPNIVYHLNKEERIVQQEDISNTRTSILTQAVSTEQDVTKSNDFVFTQQETGVGTDFVVKIYKLDGGILTLIDTWTEIIHDTVLYPFVNYRLQSCFSDKENIL